MSDVATYEFPSTGQPVRLVELDGEPWFVARDVCAVLGLANGRQAVARLEDDEKGVTPMDTPGGVQQILVVNEPGLYSLIFRSDKAEAAAFRRWVFHDVLPAIRRTARYEVAPLDELEVARRYVAALEDKRALAARVAELEPAAQAWETLAAAEGDYAVADAAKILSRDPAIKVGRDRLFTVMEGFGWVYRQGADRRWRVYQSQVECGRLSELPASHYHPRTGELVLDPPQVRVTVKGIEEIRRRLVAHSRALVGST